MESVPVTEGYAPFDAPGAGKPCQTWYRVYGSLASAPAPPLVVLHGGPGSTHAYMTPHADLARTGARAVVLYDQLGCGRSTRLPDRRGDARFWSVRLFVAELENLLAHLGIAAREGGERDESGRGFAVLGNSWGAMLAAEFAVRRPAGLRRLVLADGPADMYVRNEARRQLLRGFSEEEQDLVRRREAGEAVDTAAYRQFRDKFLRRHMCRLKSWPPEVNGMLDQDTTAGRSSIHRYGPLEFSVTGNLRDWSVVPELHKIDVPTLLLNGRYDTAQDCAMAPFFQNIPRVRWYTFAESSHLPHLIGARAENICWTRSLNLCL